MNKKTASGRNRRSTREKAGFRLFLLSLPFLAGTFIFAYFPLTGWIYSFYNFKPGRSLADCEFVGMKWFIAPFNNPVLRSQFFRVMKNTICINLLYMASMILPLIFAMFLMEIHTGWYRKVVQTLTTIPNFISWVLVYAAFFSMLSTDGLLNSLLLKAGLETTPVNFLIDSHHMWLKMLGLHLWKGLGWNAIIYISAITSIDSEIYEAAAIDGAGRFQRMRYITAPNLMPTYCVLLVLQIGNFINNGIDQYLVFSNAMNQDYIEVLDLYVYRYGLQQGNISYATAVGMWKSLISVILVMLANGISKKIRGSAIF
ncbi:MAG: ABC transporter permease [Lachnospiraceae bacterium]|jgi:putative aldouronate transport system permease protein